MAKSVGSRDTQDVLVGPIAGTVFVNIDLVFDIKGNVSGSGTVGGIGIGGKASGSENATLSYCHPVIGTTNTLDAIKRAFSGLVFPFEPS